MESVEIIDLYEAAYLITKGGRIEEVRCVPLTSSILGCSIMVSDPAPDLLEKRKTFWQKEAMVNLYAFRNAYTQVNGLVHEAKKAFKKELRQKGQESFI